MPSDRVLEPWRSFLAEIDAATPRPLELHCIGGFAVTMHYELVRATGDLDVFDVIPNDAAHWLASLAYHAELRPYVSGPPERHDLTLKLWLEAITEERAARYS
jgi:hypothetical protein